jgi:excisionase family DNA binding protein
METLLTVQQAADRLQLTPWTIREQLKAGKLRGVKVGSQWRIISESLITEAQAVRAQEAIKNAERQAGEFAIAKARALAALNEFTADAKEWRGDALPLDNEDEWDELRGYPERENAQL